MNERNYLIISAVIFGVVAVIHLVRAVNGWAFELGPWNIPMWVSWIGAVIPAGLSVLGFRMAFRPD